MGTSKSGYTILELLLFIAISSFMFVVAISSIGGRQAQVQFTQAVREFDAKIRDAINDVSTGYYPTNTEVNCVVSGGTITIQNAASSGVGTNNDCIYIGKALQFAPDGRRDTLRIYTLAGKRYENAAEMIPSSSISKADPVAVALPGDATFQNTRQDYQLLYGLEVTKVLKPGTSTQYGILGLITSFGSSAGSESQSIQIGGLRGSSLNATESAAVSVMNALSDNPVDASSNGYFEQNQQNGLVICLLSPQGKRASVTIGKSGVANSELFIDNYDTGCDS